MENLYVSVYDRKNGCDSRICIKDVESGKLVEKCKEKSTLRKFSAEVVKELNLFTDLACRTARSVLNPLSNGLVRTQNEVHIKKYEAGTLNRMDVLYTDIDLGKCPGDQKLYISRYFNPETAAIQGKAFLNCI